MSYLDMRYALTRKIDASASIEPVYWYDAHTGLVILPDGKSTTIEKHTDLYALLNRVRAHSIRVSGTAHVTLFIRSGLLVADRPKQEWYASYKEWKRIHFVLGNLHAAYEREGFTVHMYGTHEYFGNETHLPTIYKAYQMLNRALASAFHLESYTVRSTPASTGKDLLERSLPSELTVYRLSDELLELIMHNFGQGRYEVLQAQRENINGLYAIDGRWMYASCVSHLPVGSPRIDKRNRFEGVRTKEGLLSPLMTGFYDVTVSVPDNWQHIGLIKAVEDVEGSDYYPNIAGETFRNWTSAAELAIAIDHNWPITIHQRILWEESKLDPLSNWRRYLVELRASLPDESKEYELVRAALRSILLHTIGSFHQVYDYAERFTPRSELPLPDNVRIKRRRHSTVRGLHWTQAVDLPAWKQKFVHPEWSATAWGRARARLSRFALRLPYQDIVSLRSDCVWSLSCPEWIDEEDTGKPGSFRQKEYTDKLTQWPKNNAEMRGFILKHNALKGIIDTDEGKEYREL